jgi:salicylate hydroxylase
MRTEQLRIAVVGAGIAGLTVAAALSRAGLRCTIFEQAPTLGEVGAGIQLSPNATRVLHGLGLADHLNRVAVRPQSIQMRRWDGGDVLMRTVLGAECAAMFGAPYYTMHRADLHAGLHGLVPEGAVQLRRRCVAVEERAESVELRFDDGSTATSDLVIGADGIHSAVRDVLVTDEPRFSGQTVYRGLVPAERLARLLGEPTVSIWLGPGQHCVWYPISGGRLVSFAATTPAGDWRGESWSEQGRLADLAGAYVGWHDEVRQVIAAAGAVTRWALHDRDTIEHWCTGRITLVGDAAHPMLPFGAQGAAQAIEDAAALAVCLGTATPDSLSAALKHYAEVRKPRTETVHRSIRENARNHHFSDGEQQRSRDQTMGDNWGLRGQEWLYGYDAERAVALS